jgi:hypothetical protein
MIREETKKPKVETEVLGLTFEMAMCMMLEIEYDGNFKYSLENARNLAK